MSENVIPFPNNNREPKRNRDYYEIGYVLGKYTDLNFRFTPQPGGNVKVEVDQDIDLKSLCNDIEDLWS